MFCVQWRDTADLQSEMVSLIEGSLQRLDLEYIDILLLHNTNQIPNFEQLTGTCFFKIHSKTPDLPRKTPDLPRKNHDLPQKTPDLPRKNHDLPRKTPIYRGVLGKGNIRCKSGSAVNRGFVWFTLCVFSLVLFGERKWLRYIGVLMYQHELKSYFVA